MKRRWVIVILTCIALVSAGLIVRAERKNRRLAKKAAAYRIRAEQGDPKYQSMMGYVYEHGKGVPEDYVEAVRWYRKSAEQGDAYGQYALSLMYHEGKGLAKDDSEALRWCRKAAEQGHIQAEFVLGESYRTGVGAPQDESEAVRWYRKSAEQVFRRPNTTWATCITTATVSSGIEFKPTTCFGRLLLTGTTTLSELLNVTGKVSQSTPEQAFGAFNKFACH